MPILFGHLARRTLAAMLGAIGGVVVLYLAVDFVDNSSAFQGAGWGLAVLDLYANKAAVVTHMVAPAAILLGASVAVSGLRATREWTAMRAPAFPIASVPTGTPAGIWAVARSASSPCRSEDASGTPSTGSSVSAAQTPARWAAAPAPQRITWIPRPAASRASFPVRSGVRCAEETCTSDAIPMSSSAFLASDMTSQSESEPIRMRTLGSLMLSLRCPCGAACPGSAPWPPPRTRGARRRRARRPARRR